MHNVSPAVDERCLACGHDARLHAAIGATPVVGAKCVTCQCTGLELPKTATAQAKREEGGA